VVGRRGIVFSGRTTVLASETVHNHWGFRIPWFLLVVLHILQLHAVFFFRAAVRQQNSMLLLRVNGKRGCGGIDCRNWRPAATDQHMTVRLVACGIRQPVEVLMDALR